jgi:cytochrome c556
MKFKALFAAFTIAAIGITGVAASDNPAQTRETLMKENGGAMGMLAKMAKGETAFDAAKVKTALETISKVGKAFPDAYPAGSETASKGSSPKIWENFEDFKAKSLKLASDADAALAAAPADQAALGPVLGAIGANCGACHEIYRIKE